MPMMPFVPMRWLVDVTSDRTLWWGRTLSDVSVTSEVPLFVEGMWVDAFPLHTDPAPINGAGGPAGIIGVKNRNMWRVCFDRHPGPAINHVFVDGHVESVVPKAMWNLKWNRKFDTKTVRTINW